MTLTAVNFKNDKSVIFNKSEIIQNQLIYIDESQSYFLDINQVGFFINPIVYGLFGKKKTTAVTINSNQVNLLNPITENESHFIIDSKVQIGLIEHPDIVNGEGHIGQFNFRIESIN